MTVGMFDTLTSGEDERQRTAAKISDKIAAATYDVRERHGDWLFGASDINAFNDRVAMSLNSICQTIEPHIHARTGVRKKVIANLEREWRERKIAGGVNCPECGKYLHDEITRAGHSHENGQEFNADPQYGFESRGDYQKRQKRQACYPGCDKNEAHAKKFHKDKSEKDARRRQSAEDGAYERNAPDHPDMHIQETYQRHTGEDLIPEGDFHAYEKRVDQGGPQKVESHDFIDVGTTHRHDSDNDNFVPKVTGKRRRQAAPGAPASGGSSGPASREYQHLARMLHADDTTGNDPNAQMGGGAMGTSGAPMTPAGGAAPPVMPPPPGGSMGGGAQMATPPPGGPPIMASREFQYLRRFLAAPVDPTPAPMPPGAGGAPMDGSMGPATLPTGPAAMSPPPEPSQAVTAPPVTAGRKWALKVIQAEGTFSARRRLLEAARNAGILAPIDYKRIAGVYRTADRNYLQQADEALTKVLNEKAEEFQNTIAPLQQALVTIQQAEQLQNPLNVSPPAGTVNVLPQQQGQDPSAGGAAAGGAGMAPQGGGGLGADPAAAALAGQQPPQQMQASWYKTRPRQARRRQAFDLGSEIDQNACAKCGTDIEGPNHRGGFHDRGGNESCPAGGRHAMPNREDPSTWAGREPRGTYRGARGRRPLGRGRQADVNDAWNSWSQNHTNRGDDSTYEQFAQEKGYAAPSDPRAKAIPKLQNGLASSGVSTTPSGGSNRGMPKKPKGAPVKAVKPQGVGISARSRTAQCDYCGGHGHDWTVHPEAHRDVADWERERPLLEEPFGRHVESAIHAPEPGYIWSKAPASVKGEFMARVGSGITPEQAYRQMIAEITEHHAKGIIGNHDAHRAANEAFGRLLLSRKMMARASRHPLAVGR